MSFILKTPLLENVGSFKNEKGELLLFDKDLIKDGKTYKVDILNPFSFQVNDRSYPTYLWSKVRNCYEFKNGESNSFGKVLYPVFEKLKEKIDISRLCDDELMNIFSFFTLDYLLINISLVNKQFFSLSNETIQILKLSNYLNEKIQDKHVYYICRCIPELESINLSSCPSITNGCFKFIEMKNESLKSINLGYNRFLSLSKISDLFDVCNQLEVINVEQLGINDSVMISISKMKNLRELRCYKSDITDKGLLLVANSCLNLETLDIGMSQITSKSLIELSKNCKNLKDVNIDDNEGLATKNGLETQGLIDFVENCPNLVHLSMKETLISSEFIKSLAKSCPLLKTLEIKYCQKRKNDDILSVLSSLKKVKVWK